MWTKLKEFLSVREFEFYILQEMVKRNFRGDVS